MPLVKMLLTKQAAKDGITVETFVAGEEYDIPEPLATMMVTALYAEPTERDFVPQATTAPIVLAETVAQTRARVKAAQAAQDAAAAAEEKSMQVGAPENKMAQDAEHARQVAAEALQRKAQEDAAKKTQEDAAEAERQQQAGRQTRTPR